MQQSQDHLSDVHGDTDAPKLQKNAENHLTFTDKSGMLSGDELIGKCRRRRRWLPLPRYFSLFIRQRSCVRQLR
jgi:hypothetical protein